MQEQLNQIYGYLYGMWKYRWSALAITWLIAVVGWLAVFSLSDNYESKAVVYIDTQSLLKPLLKGLAVDTDTAKDVNVIERSLISRNNLLEVIHDTDLHLRLGVGEDPSGLITELVNKIQIRGGKKNSWARTTNVYEISYESDSPQITYQVVNKLLNTFIDSTLNSSRTDTAMAQEFLDKQIEAYEARLNAAEKRLADFQKENVGLMPSEKGGYYARLQSKIDALENTRSQLRLAQQRHSELQRQISGESPLLDSTGDRTIALKLRQAQDDLANLLSQYTEAHPDVQAVRAQIEDLRKMQELGRQSIGNSADDSLGFNPVYQDLKIELSKAGIEVGTLKVQLADQQSKIDDLRRRVDSIPEVEAELARLNRDYQITRDRYLSMVERRESAKLVQDVEQNTSQVTFRVIEPPRVADRPSSPNRLLLLTGVLVVALGGGLGWALLRYLLKPAFLSLDQIRDSLDVPVLGTVRLYVSPIHRLQRRLQLASFLMVVVVLLGVYGGVVWKKDDGSQYVRDLITQARM